MAVMSESPVIGASAARGQLPAGRCRVDAEHPAVAFTTRHLFGITAYRGRAARRLTVGLGIVAQRDQTSGPRS